MNLYCIVAFEVFTAVTMKNAVLWDVAPCISCELNRRFGECVASIFRVEKIRERGTSVSRWQQTGLCCSPSQVPCLLGDIIPSLWTDWVMNSEQ
jgi:hypothetical protein